MSDAWFENAIAPDGVEEDGCHPSEAQALKDYIRGSMTVEKAAGEITKPTEAAQDPDDHVRNLWGLLHDALIDIPSAQAKIIQLLQEIQNLRPVDLTNKERNGALRAPSEQELWRDLPAFVNMWSDHYRWKFTHKDWQQHKDAYDAEKWDEVASMVRKYARIEAQLVARHVDGTPLYWGYLCVCDALERSNAMLDIEVPAAREWLVIAGKMLRDPVASEAKGTELGMKRNLWKGGEEMSMERWAFWKERLRSIQSHPALRNSTKEAAKEALEAMDALDGQ